MTASAPTRHSFDALLKAFLVHLDVERGLSKHTLAAYADDCRRFFASLADGAATSPEAAHEKEIFDFLVSERKRGRNVTSVRRSLAGLRTFFRFLVRERVVATNPARNLENPRTWERLPCFLQIDEVSRLLKAAVENPSRHPRRDLALLELVYACGLRVGEATALKLESVRHDLGILRVFGKGSKERIVPVSRRALRAVSDYRDVERPRLVQRAATDLLFVSRGGKPLGREVVNAFLKKYAALAGLAGNVTPHTLRHSFATHMIQGGADLRVVQEILGHAKVDTTEIYTHLDNGDLRATIKKYHPRG